jgi:hypothetical protein
MALPKSEPRRPLHLAVGNLIAACGGYKNVAALCMVSPENVNKWKQDANGNGQVIPLVHLQTLLANVGENLTDLTLQNAADEIVQEHILNLFHRYAYPTERVFQFIELLQGQQIRRAIGQ